jgi:putative inorganic carbon (hco3(-)) transporter
MTMGMKSEYFARWLGYLPFLVFYFLSVRIIFLSFYHASSIQALWFLPALLALMFLSSKNSQWGLYGFIASIPLLSGLQCIGFVQNIPILSFGFAGLYLSWFSKRVLIERRSVLPTKGIEVLVDVLSSMIILSLLILFATGQPHYLFRLLWFAPFQAQDSSLYGIEAAYIILQGLLLYRIIRMEVSHLDQKYLISIISIHLLTVLAFSTIQIVFNIPLLDYKLGGAAIYAPFDDKHSYSSYLSLLFFVVLFTIYNKSKYKQWVNSIFLLILFILIILSWSRIAWLAVCIIMLVSAFMLISNKKVPVYITLLLIGTLICSNVLFASSIKKSNNLYIKRLETLIVFNTLAQDINTRFRLFHWKRAARMIADYPLTGSGVGSYYNLSPAYAGANESPLMWGFRENTHNYYLQFAAEMGLPALVVFLIVVLCTFKTGLSSVSRGEGQQNITLGIILGLSAYLITCVTGHPLLLSNQHLLFWSALAIIPISAESSEDGCLPSRQSSRWRYGIALLFGVLLIAYGFRWWGNSHASTPYEYGVYKLEDWAGKKMRWTTEEARMRLKAAGPILTFEIFAAPQCVSARPQSVRLFLNGLLCDELHLLESRSEKLYYPIPGKKGEFFEIKIVVNETFNPHKLGFSEDRRDLGVAISDLEFIDNIPGAGIGFYSSEISSAEIPGWPSEVPSEFRWTGRRALMNMGSSSTNGITLFLLCAHPEVATFPVEFKIMGNGRVIRDEIFRDKLWKTIRIRNGEIKDSEVLIFQVSRTWNPKKAGISEDSRDLGIAVAALKE